MTYYAYQRLSTANSLTHHGVKGMKWGVRNGPPYHLDMERINDGYRKMAKEAGYEGKDIDTVAESYSRAAKMAMIGGGAIIAAGGAYCLYKYANQNLDTVIKAGTAVQRITTNSEATVRDRFYATANDLDKLKYEGIYANQINNRLIGRSEQYIKVMKPQQNIKVAGLNSSKKIYKELKIKHPEALNGVSYEHFNQQFLIAQTGQQADIAKDFFKMLEAKGYGGVLDWNDAKASGYNSIRPVVFFNQQNNMTVKSIKKVSDTTRRRKQAKAYGAITVQTALSQKRNMVLAGGATISGASSMRKAYQSGSNKKKNK